MDVAIECVARIPPPLYVQLPVSVIDNGSIGRAGGPVGAGVVLGGTTRRGRLEYGKVGERWCEVG